MAVRQNNVIARLKAGETLLCVLPRGNSESELPYQYLSGGGRVTKATYQKIKPQLSPICDGLFPDAEPQEWRWSHAE